jgi:hypothetical protein
LSRVLKENKHTLTKFFGILHYFMTLPGTEFENSTPAPLSVLVGKTMGKLALLGKTTGVWSKA